MATEQMIKHVVRHHPGIAILSATINGTTVYFAAEGGESVHTFLSQVAQGECSNKLLLTLNSDPGVVNTTWYGLSDAAAEIGMNVKYAFSTLTDPACVVSMTVKCFAAFNAVAPCIVKGVLQTGVELTKAAAVPEKVGAAFAGMGALLGAAGLFAGVAYCWHKHRRANYQDLDKQHIINNGL